MPLGSTETLASSFFLSLCFLDTKWAVWLCDVLPSYEPYSMEHGSAAIWSGSATSKPSAKQKDSLLSVSDIRQWLMWGPWVSPSPSLFTQGWTDMLLGFSLNSFSCCFRTRAAEVSVIRHFTFSPQSILIDQNNNHYLLLWIIFNWKEKRGITFKTLYYILHSDLGCLRMDNRAG